MIVNKFEVKISKSVENKIENTILLKKWYLIAFFEGLFVIALEIFGAKILNSYFGSMLMVWTFVLTITLFSLAIGYYFGGKIAYSNQEKKISRSLYLCAFSICFSLLASNYLFSLVLSSGFYFGLFFSSLIILTPALICLGTISPLLIQLHNKEVNSTGQSAGTIYFISTIGGVLGAFLIGFYILENFGITYPLIIISFLLLLLGMMTYSWKRTINFTLFILFLITAIFSIKRIGFKKTSVLKIQYESEGILGQLKVIDYKASGQNFSSRRLLIDGISQTNIINSPEAYSFWSYTHILNAFSSLKNNDASTLLLGLGGGSVARELQNRKVKFDVVELDKRIIEIAPKFFYLKNEGFNVIHDDARRYIRKTDKKYDVVIYDVLFGEVQPNYLFTKESLSELKTKLNTGAITIVNYQGIINGTKDLAFKSLYKTFENAGFNVYYWASNPNSFNDIIFVLSEEKIDFSKIIPNNLSICCQTNPNMVAFFKNPISNLNYKHDFSNIKVLEDDKPKLEFLSQESIFEWRMSMVKDITAKEIEQGISLYK